MVKSRTALVTGGSGFIGSHLVDSLLKENWNVRCLLRRTSSREFLPPQQIEVVEGDLSDKSSLKKALNGVQWVFHLAGRIKGKGREEFFQTNYQGTKNLLEAIVEITVSIEGFIYTSSLSAAGPSSDGHLITESETPRPVSYYGQSKLAAEKEIQKYGPRYPVVILRPAIVYGPREKEIFPLIRLINHGIKLCLGGKDDYFSVVHVADLVQTILRATKSPSPGVNTFFISDGQVYSWQQVLDIMARILSKKAVTVKLPLGLTAKLSRLWSLVNPGAKSILYHDKMREMAYHYWVCDNSKIRSRLGFEPYFNFTSGMEHTIRWYRQQGWLS